MHKAITLFLLIVICILISNFCPAQSYYYYVNEVARGQDKIIYKTLLNLQPDGSAIARVQYNAGPNDELFLYELSLSDSVTDATSTNLRLLICSKSPVPLLNNDPSFLQPRFIFRKVKDSSSAYYEPAGVEIISNTGKWVTANTTTSQEKTYNDLKDNEPFVSAFYFESDPFYQYLFNDKVRGTVMALSQRMFLITVANTKDEKIGESTAVDLKNVNNVFSKIASSLGISKIIPLQIYGNEYSKLAVQAALKALAAQKPGADDIIIFYFSGHGFRLPQDVSAYPNLSFRTVKNKKNNEVGDYIPLEEIYKNIMALHPKVCMVIADCCNTNIFQDPLFGPDIIRPKGGGALGDFNLETAKKLFLPSFPLSMIVGSVEQGYRSWGDPTLGGYFTYYFTAALQKNLWGYYSNSLSNFGGQANAAWLRILLDARKDTYWKSLSIQCGATANDRCVQQAVLKVTPQ